MTKKSPASGLQSSVVSPDGYPLEHDEREEVIYAEKVGLLYSHALPSIAATLINAVLLCVVQWNVVAHQIIIA